jgi:hypothetical protein
LRKTSRLRRVPVRLQNRLHDSFSNLLSDVRLFIERSSGSAVPPSGKEWEALALRLFGFQCRNVPVYGVWCRSLGISEASVTDWKSIPALPTHAFKDFDVSSLDPADRVAVFHSSGTTATRPSRHHHSVATLALYEASLEAGFLRGLAPLPTGGFRFVSLTPEPGSAPHSSLVHMIAHLGRRLSSGEAVFLGRPGADGWDLPLEPALETLVRLAREGRPILLLGTAFQMVHLMDRLAGSGSFLRLPPGSRVMETGGYKGRSRSVPRDELHALIRGRLCLAGDGVVTEYGMSELSSQAYGGESGLELPPWARLLLVDPESGKEVGEGTPGLVRVVDLSNVGSVMAVETGDLAERRGGLFRLLGRAETAEPRGCSLMTP